MLEVEAFLVDREGWEWGEEEGQKEREEEKHFRCCCLLLERNGSEERGGGGKGVCFCLCLCLWGEYWVGVFIYVKWFLSKEGKVIDCVGNLVEKL